MENLVFTQLSILEVRELFRQELENYFGSFKELQGINPQADQPLTIQQAGELLNLSVPTLYGYVHRSEIPVYKRGKRLYFSKPELLEWIKQGKKKTTAEITSEAEALVVPYKKRGKL
jgi:excisionase family DNA binding protein